MVFFTASNKKKNCQGWPNTSIAGEANRITETNYGKFACLPPLKPKKNIIESRILLVNVAILPLKNNNVMWQFQICLQTYLDKNFGTSSSKLRWRLHDLKGKPEFTNMKNLGAFDGESDIGVSKIKLHIGYSCKLSLRFSNCISMNEISPKRPEKISRTKRSSGQHSMGSHCILRVLWPEASCFLSKKTGRFVSCAYASNWWTPMVQIHEMSEQIRIEWLQFQHWNSTCRLTSCMFQRASPSVPVPPDVWKALWSLKPPAMSKRWLGSRPKGVRKVVEPFTLLEVLAAIFRVTRVTKE